jgi:ubiquitin carboxyl-terminal hydrolase 10
VIFNDFCFATHSTMTEMYRHLSLDLQKRDPCQEVRNDPNQWSVEDGIAHFFASEQLEVHCEKCYDGNTATQTLAVASRPKSLILQLKRFSVQETPRKIRSSEKMSRDQEGLSELRISKNRDPIKLSRHLDLTTYCTSQDDIEPLQYRLVGIVHHHGSTPSSGHYTADVLRSDGQAKEWISFDDGVSHPIALEDLVNICDHQRTAYMLLYKLDE